jgi:glycosyltransferase involved in cell wall biosynthesis
MGRRPTVLVLIKGLGIGGAERLIADGAAFWNRDRYDYRVAYVLPWKDQVVGELEALDVPVRCIGTARGLRPPVYRTLRSLMAEWGVDLIHAHLPTTGILARLVGGAPVVYTEHNVVGSYRLPTRIANRLTYPRNAAVIAVSDAVGESLEGYPGPDARVIANGVSARRDPDAAASARAEAGAEAGETFIVHVGNIRPHKGHSNLIAAVAHLVETHPDVRVISIGGEKYDGDLERVRTEAEEAGVGDRLAFLGRRVDARAFTEAADIYVNPADFEGLPVSILEAMALGRPVVATDVGGVPSIIREGTGILVPPKDPEALAAAVGALIDDPERASMLGKGAEALVEDEFGLERMIRRTEAVYEEVLGR